MTVLKIEKNSDEFLKKMQMTRTKIKFITLIIQFSAIKMLQETMKIFLVYVHKKYSETLKRTNDTIVAKFSFLYLQ